MSYLGMENVTLLEKVYLKYKPLRNMTERPVLKEILLEEWLTSYAL